MIVHTDQLEKELPAGTTVRACLEALNAFPVGTLAALKGGTAVELNEPVTEDRSEEHTSELQSRI